MLIPFKCYIYCTQDKYKHLYDLRKVSDGVLMLSVVDHNKTSLVAKGYLNGKVIGEFVCDRIDKQIVFHKGITRIMVKDYQKNIVALCRAAVLSLDELHDYIDKDGGLLEIIYGWHISDLKIYDKPKGLEEFSRECHKDDCEKCGDCPHLEMWGGSFPCEDGGGEQCGVGNLKPITRPPQSWCYVEE